MFRFFENLVDPFVSYEQTDTPPSRVIPFLLDYARPFRRVFAVTAVVTALAGFADVALIWYVGRVVDLLAQDTPARVWETHGTEFLWAALAVVVLRPILAVSGVALLHNTVMPGFTALARWRAHRHVLRQPVGWFENDFAGRIANRVMQLPQAATDAVFQTFDAMTFALTTVIGSLWMLSAADPRLVAPLVVWIGLYLLLIRWTLRRAGPAAQAASDARSAIMGRVVDSYTNIHSVKMFAHHNLELAHARDAIENGRQKVNAEMRVITSMDLMLTLLNGALIVSVTGLAMWLWYHGSATVGTVAAASALVLRLNNMTYWIMWATTTLVQSLGVVAEGMETVAQPVTLTDAPMAPSLGLKGGRIEIRDVSHHYGRGSGGLDRVSLAIQPGEKVGLVGRSGAGKSTLVKLFLRFYDVEGGAILIDGQDIRHVTQDSLRARVGMVQQDSSLLHRSIRENILYGRPEATEAEMIAAAKRAEAHDFILTLADQEGRTGYSAEVGERGVKLSGGQRQRIAIARVILKDAPILVLDEATSALDSEVEAAIQDTLYRVMEGKTVIAIAHRLSTIAHMDRIVVMDDGRIAEQGTHGDLIAKGGLYARFWARQSGGFLGSDEVGEAAE